MWHEGREGSAAEAVQSRGRSGCESAWKHALRRARRIRQEPLLLIAVSVFDAVDLLPELLAAELDVLQGLMQVLDLSHVVMLDGLPLIGLGSL